MRQGRDEAQGQDDDQFGRTALGQRRQSERDQRDAERDAVLPRVGREQGRRTGGDADQDPGTEGGHQGALPDVLLGPQQEPDAGLNVKIEKFFEWCVEQKPFENGGKKPEIEGVHYVDDLEPYIERKLFTVNTSHATAAYYGYNRQVPYIHEVLQNKELHDIVRAAVKETANLIVTKHGISAQEQDDYVEKIVSRISNPTLKDNVERVGRAPLRKLSRKERFVGPAAQLAEMGEKVDALLGSIEMAYRFQNVEGDEESAELAKILKNNSAEDVVNQVNGLDSTHPLFAKIVPIVKKVQEDTKSKSSSL